MTPTAPGSADAVPAGHSAQNELADVPFEPIAYWPALHGVHEDAPAGENAVAPHGQQIQSPAARAAGLEKNCAAQMHVDEPGEGATLLGGHALHEVLPAALYVFTGHRPQYPGPEAVKTTLAPAGAAPETNTVPAEHAMQLAAPTERVQSPGAHATQGDPSLAGFANPAGHRVQPGAFPAPVKGNPAVPGPPSTWK